MIRTGPKMREALKVISANPGCAKLPVAKAIGPHGSTYFGYGAVNRAITHGLVRAVFTGSGYRLFLTAAGEKEVSLWHTGVTAATRGAPTV